MTNAAPSRIAEARAVLAAIPEALDALLRRVPDVWLDADEGPGTWSPRAVLGHLTHGERTDWIPRARHLLRRGVEVPRTSFDRSAHPAGPARPVVEPLEEFSRLRRDDLAASDQLELTAERLARRGTHPEFGSVTLAQQLATWVAHDLSHLVPIEGTMAQRKKAACGPWANDLRVLGGSRGAWGR
jgi:hypothetical protein